MQVLPFRTIQENTSNYTNYGFDYRGTSHQEEAGHLREKLLARTWPVLLGLGFGGLKLWDCESRIQGSGFRVRRVLNLQRPRTCRSEMVSLMPDMLKNRSKQAAANVLGPAPWAGLHPSPAPFVLGALPLEAPAAAPAVRATAAG